ncbi:MAG TPA: hypothetical protein VGS28_04680 [Candidatus Saccharimonadales bacterium]|nr:hypothetical protein [Candidatus Saccharimonadales bacterium]
MSSQESSSSSSKTPLDLFVIDLENLNHIQRSILHHLYINDSSVYSDLKPKELTGNSFNYHLRHVTEQNLVEKIGDKYRLTAKGRLLVDSVSLENMKLKLRPTSGMSVMLHSGQHGILLYESKRAPLRGFTGFPFGKLRLGDSLEGTFERILNKRNINLETVLNVKELGLANIRYYDQGQLVAHRMVTVWYADYTGPSIVTDTIHGSSTWLNEHGRVPNTLAEVEAFINWPVDKTVIELTSQLS